MPKIKKFLRSPIKFFGGKGNLVKKLLPLIPQHIHYVEVFGGGASLLFAKDPNISKIETYNDIYSEVVNFFRVLRDEKKFKKFYKKVLLIPYSREEFYYHKNLETDDEIERAVRFFVLARQNFGGFFGRGWSYSLSTFTKKNISSEVSRYLSVIELLPEIHQRLMRVQIENDDFRNIIKRYNEPYVFLYCDPPYLPETRRSGEFKHEMTREDHEELVELLLQFKGKVMLSGYKNEVYKKLEENGWKRLDFKTVCHAVGRTRLTKILGSGSATKKQPRIESVWLNYDIGGQPLKPEIEV